MTSDNDKVIGFTVGSPLPEHTYYINRTVLHDSITNYSMWIIGFESVMRCNEFYSSTIAIPILGAKLAALGGVYAITDGGASPQDAQEAQ